MVSQSITWNDGSTDVIEVQAASWTGSQPVFIKTGENFGNKRGKTIIFYSGTSSKTAAVLAQQSAYEVEAPLQAITWEDTETGDKELTITTNGTQLYNFNATLTGSGTDKFSFDAPVQDGASGDTTSYKIAIRPTGTNGTDEDFTASLHITAGVGDFISFDIPLTQKAIVVVSSVYKDCYGEWQLENPAGITTIPAAGNVDLTLVLTKVRATREDTMSNGTVRRFPNVVVDNWSSDDWDATIQVGSPVRSKFNQFRVDFNSSSGRREVNLSFPSLGTTSYVAEDTDWVITLDAYGGSIVGAATSYDFEIGIESNTETVTYGPIEVVNELSANPVNGVYVIDANSTFLSVDLGCKKTSTWTSGSSSTTDAEVIGDGTDSGIQDAVIPDTSMEADGNPITGWVTATRQWPVDYNGRNVTEVSITLTPNVYVGRTFTGKWKTPDSPATQTLEMQVE